MTRFLWTVVAAAAIGGSASGALAADDSAAKAIYESGCIGCHGTGVLGAPKLGDTAAWAPRVAAGLQAVVNAARAGKGSMPPKGGNMALTEAQLLNVVTYMVAQSGGVPAAAAKPAPPQAAKAAAPPAAPAPAVKTAAAPAPATKTAAAPPAAASPAPAAKAGDDAAAKAIYDNGCAGCHGTGVLGAPKPGDAAAWKARSAGGVKALVDSARAGKGAMPPRGGNAALTDAQLLAVVTYMMGPSSGASAAAKPAAAPAVASAAPAAPVAAPAPVVASAPPPAPAAAPAPVAVPVAAVPGVNSFNRLLRPAQRNRPPAEDGIHDPGNDGTLALQAPLAAFAELPRSNAGNRVDWVKSLSQGKIAPRADRVDAKAVPAVMDLNIVREVKGSMPDVVYPHKQHTEWLDCSNCHPAIFKPQKGANQISMAAILLGEACGVCHGKVAFPVSECRLCHSKSKTPGTAVAAPAPR